jgi:hypothetical protein
MQELSVGSTRRNLARETMCGSEDLSVIQPTLLDKLNR